MFISSWSILGVVVNHIWCIVLCINMLDVIKKMFFFRLQFSTFSLLSNIGYFVGHVFAHPYTLVNDSEQPWTVFTNQSVFLKCKHVGFNCVYFREWRGDLFQLWQGLTLILSTSMTKRLPCCAYFIVIGWDYNKLFTYLLTK